MEHASRCFRSCGAERVRLAWWLFHVTSAKRGGTEW
jgi:hypothetical protein